MSFDYLTKRSEKVLFFLYLALLVWLPLPFGGNRPMYWMPAEVWTLVLTSCWLILFLMNRVHLTSAFKSARIAILLLLAVCIWIALQGAQIWPGDMKAISHDPRITQAQFLKSICYLSIFCLTLLLVRSSHRLSLLAMTLVLSGTFQAVYGTLMTVTGTDAIWFEKKVAYVGVATGTFINRNHLAGYLEMTLAIGIGLLIANLNREGTVTWRESLRRITTTLLGPKARIRICLALMIIGLIMSRSRMGNTAFFASMMIAGSIGLFYFRRAGRNVVILFASLLIIDIFLMGAFFGIEKLQQRFQATSLEEEQRIDVNILSIPIIEDNLLTGTGSGAYYSTFPQYRNDKISVKYVHAHSDLIEFPSELGLIGTIPLVLVVILSFFTSIRVQLVRRSPLMKAMGFSSAMGIIAIMMHSITDFNLQISGNAGTFMLVLGLPFLALAIDHR